MAYNYEYPYTDPNRYNSDWVLKKVTDLIKEWADITGQFSDLKTAVDEFFTWVKWKFENLDVNDAIYEQIERMYNDGRLTDVINTAIEMLTKNNFDYFSYFNSQWIGQWCPAQGGAVGKGNGAGYLYLGYSSTGLNLPQGTIVKLQKVRISDGNVMKTVDGSDTLLGHINGITYDPNTDLVHVARFQGISSAYPSWIDTFDSNLEYIGSKQITNITKNVMDISYYNGHLYLASADSANGNDIYEYDWKTNTSIFVCKLPSYSLQFCSVIDGKIYANANMEIKVFDLEGNFIETKFLELTSKDKCVYLQETEWIDSDSLGNKFLGLSESTYRTWGVDFRHVVCSLSKSLLSTVGSPFSTIKAGNSYHVSPDYHPIQMGNYAYPFDCINRASRLASTLGGGMININCHNYNYNENVILEGNSMLQNTNSVNTVYVRANSLGQNVNINGNYGNYFYDTIGIGISGTGASSLVIEHGVTYSQYGGMITKQQTYDGYPVWCSGYYTPINVQYTPMNAEANVYFYATQNTYVGTTSICSFPSITNTQTRGTIKDSGVNVATENPTNKWVFNNTLTDNQTFKIECGNVDMRGIWQGWNPNILKAGGVGATNEGNIQIYNATFNVSQSNGTTTLTISDKTLVNISQNGSVSVVNDFDIGIIRIVPF